MRAGKKLVGMFCASGFTVLSQIDCVMRLRPVSYRCRSSSFKAQPKLRERVLITMQFANETFQRNEVRMFLSAGLFQFYKSLLFTAAKQIRFPS